MWNYSYLLRFIFGLCFLVLFNSLSAQEENKETSLLDGMTLEAVLLTKVGKDSSCLQISLKNTTSSVKSLLVESGTDRGFLVATIDADGRTHPLHDPKVRQITTKDKKELVRELALQMEANSISSHFNDISPGETLIRTIPVTSAEIALLKKDVVQISFSLFYEKEDHLHRIKAQPIKLTEKFLEDK